MHKDCELLDHAISAGADGYVLKEDSDKELYFAIEKIRCGGVYISPRLSEELTGEWVRMRRGIIKPSLELLTKREREVLRFIAEGKSNKEIANLLFISVRTAEKHRSNIMDKLDIRKATDLVKYYVSKGFMS